MVGAKVGYFTSNFDLLMSDGVDLRPLPLSERKAALARFVLGDGPQDMLCSAARRVSLLNAMVPMYLLMSAFHLSPWLELVSLAGKRLRARPRRHQ